MSFHGGFLGVAAAVIVFARINRVDILRLADLVAPCAPIAILLVRIANFINGELWGRITHVPWGMVFCNAHIRAANLGACPAGPAPRHPSQLYEAALEGLVMFLILRWATHRAHWLSRQGGVAGLFILCYGVFRIALETVRNPDLDMPAFPLGLTMGMMLSAPMVLFGGWLIWRAMRQAPPAAAAATEPPPV
jgi:phosphatidylglycerol:prolipoprotein diacylglycerol transferase